MIAGEVSGVMLTHVARAVDGIVMTETVKFNVKEGKNIKTEVEVKDPVVVFFPNKTTQVMSLADAEMKGFLQMPSIMNFDQVQDQNTPAGRYKFAMMPRDKMEAWMVMEDTLISRCISKTGHPLEQGTISDTSIYLSEAA